LVEAPKLVHSCYEIYKHTVADPEGENPAMAPIQFGYRLWPTQ